MLLINFLFAFLIALVLSTVLIKIYFGKWEWPRFAFVFLLLFFTVWAAGIWITPVGPQLYGAYWLIYVITGLMIALMFAAFFTTFRTYNTPRQQVTLPEDEPEELVEQGNNVAMGTAFGLIYWILVALMIVVIGYRYYITQ